MLRQHTHPEMLRLYHDACCHPAFPAGQNPDIPDRRLIRKPVRRQIPRPDPDCPGLGQRELIELFEKICDGFPLERLVVLPAVPRLVILHVRLISVVNILPVCLLPLLAVRRIDLLAGLDQIVIRRRCRVTPHARTAVVTS